MTAKPRPWMACLTSWTLRRAVSRSRSQTVTVAVKKPYATASCPEERERFVCVSCFGTRAAVDEGGLVPHCLLFEQGREPLLTLKPVLSVLLQLRVGLLLAQKDEPGDPPIFEGELIEVVEDSRVGGGWK